MVRSTLLDDPRADGRSRPRVRTDAKIAAAVTELIRAAGPAAVTIEAVSARSGVARTTLYRRYKDRYELLASVAEQVAPLPFTSAEPTFDGLVQMIRGVQGTFESRIGVRLIGYTLSSDEDFLRGWRQAVMQPRLRTLTQFFARGIAEGVFRPDAEPGRIVEMICGAAVLGSFARGRLPEEWAQEMASLLWPAIAR